MVTSRGAAPAGGSAQSAGTFSFGISAGSVGGTIGGGVMTETGPDGTTVHDTDDTGTRVPVTVNDANVRGLEIVVRSPAC